MKRNLVVFAVSLLLIVVAFLVFPRKTSDPTAVYSPATNSPTEVKPVEPKVEPTPEPVKPADPPKVEPTVVTGPQPGDALLPIHLPPEVWKTAMVIGEDIYLYLPPGTPVTITKGYWTATFQTYSAETEPMWKPNGARGKNTVYMVGVFTAEDRARRGVNGIGVYFAGLPEGTNRVNPKAVPGEYVFTSPASDWLFSRSLDPEYVVEFEGREKFNFCLVWRGPLDDATKQEKDPYKRMRKLFELWKADNAS